MSEEESVSKTFKPDPRWLPRKRTFVQPATVVSKDFKASGPRLIRLPDPATASMLLEDATEETTAKATAASSPVPVPDKAAPLPPPPPPPPVASPDPVRLKKAYQEGYEAGERAALQQKAIEHAVLQEHLQRLVQAVEAFAVDPLGLFDPVKRLTLHLAEEVVRGELVTPVRVIDRLVQACLEEIQFSGGLPVKIHLHPEDARAYREFLGDRAKDWLWVEDPLLHPGSVRLRTDATTVEDLLEHRLQSVAEGVLGAGSTWQPRERRMAGRVVATQEREETGFHDRT